MKKGITHGPRCFVTNAIFSYLTLKLTLTLRMTLNNFRNSRTGMKMRLVHLFLPSFVEISYLTLKLTFDLEFTKMPETFQADTHRI